MVLFPSSASAVTWALISPILGSALLFSLHPQLSFVFPPSILWVTLFPGLKKHHFLSWCLQPRNGYGLPLWELLRFPYSISFGFSMPQWPEQPVPRSVPKLNWFWFLCEYLTYKRLDTTVFIACVQLFWCIVVTTKRNTEEDNNRFNSYQDA